MTDPETVARALRDISDLEKKTDSIKEEVVDLEIKTSNLALSLDTVKFRIRSIDGLIGWFGKIMASAVVGGIMAFIIKGGLVL
tara:strand:+ start:2463 stop:2711 length:249 start_codon:yes stop_codon:yes gene_type:complete